MVPPSLEKCHNFFEGPPTASVVLFVPDPNSVLPTVVLHALGGCHAVQQRHDLWRHSLQLRTSCYHTQSHTGMRVAFEQKSGSRFIRIYAKRIPAQLEVPYKLPSQQC